MQIQMVPWNEFDFIYAEVFQAFLREETVDLAN
jgi:hypothetical protein